MTNEKKNDVPPATAQHASESQSGTVQCALTGKEIPSDEAYWAPPLVTTRQLFGTIFSNITLTPGNLGHVLFDEQPDVPYAPDAREELAARRTTEQVKLLLILLLLVALIVVPVFLLLQ